VLFRSGDQKKKELTRLMMLGVEEANYSAWKYLVSIAHPWKRELYVKGRKLPASTVWSGMIVNKLTREQAADNWELPLEAIDEIILYCQSNRELLEMEAGEEKRRLSEKGIKIEPKVISRRRLTS